MRSTGSVASWAAAVRPPGGPRARGLAALSPDVSQVRRVAICGRRPRLGRAQVGRRRLDRDAEGLTARRAV